MIESPWDQPGRREALALAKGLEASASALERVGREATPEAAAWAFGQWELRKRARAKFALAEEMLFTRSGLEMASHERVASFHSSLFTAGGPFVDATCGIGADSLGLAARGPVESWDIDPVHLSLALHNAKVHGLSLQAKFQNCLEGEWEGKLVFADPARRTESRRLRTGEDCLPSLASLLEKALSSRQTWIKLSPLLPDPVLESAGHGLLFVSHQGECAEALMESGPEAGPPTREAILVEEGIRLASSPLPSAASQVQDWIYEPDPAAQRAHAHGAFGLEALGGPFGWLTGPSLPPTPWLTPFLVRWQGAWREKAVASELQELRLDSVKTRGLPELNPGLILSSLRKKAKGEATEGVELLLYRDGAKVKAVLAQRRPWPTG